MHAPIPHALGLLCAATTLVGAMMVITRKVVVHAVLYLVVTLLALAVVLALLGAPFAAALEVIIYAGAIMVLFVFVVMMLNLGQADSARESEWMRPRAWLGPALLAALLCAELLYALPSLLAPLPPPFAGPATETPLPPAPPLFRLGVHDVGLSLFGPYVLMVELVSFLLLAGLVSAFHIGRRRAEER
ncbi:NADH-quinone oxidoreductase subunit J [Acetobacter sp. TBRC 12305]|uniref:NADH-quinone oxidoreductase subunit J n=1 Tax=Acetobacter garciniae TaxID=2817435 RepID=A0A939KNI3_9PROT|nr:NADH-quinone oxidoreductase subunit J [Acetobacter garciniae]MBO1325735.1 NADH-quinone oxidoreductase subunit J [Acetobacter garciniae]MBX0345635.1 NADH-quinone oxidoreductase subunit J [Acetobacter garciniae]